jgi:RNA polymerase sigma factor (sigma-70 family)
MGKSRAEKEQFIICIMNRYGNLIKKKCYFYSIVRRLYWEDIMQDVLEKMWLSLDTLDMTIPLKDEKMWVINMVRRVVRHSEKLQNVLENEPKEAIEEVHDIPYSDYDMADREMVDDLKEMLEPDDRKVVEYIMQGYSNKEIAQKMGINQNTMNQKKNRIIGKMRKIFDEQYGNKK